MLALTVEGISNLKLDDQKKVLKDGAGWAVSHGLWNRKMICLFIEANGCLPGADPEARYQIRALERGKAQVGTLGSGNHFVEVGYVAEIYDSGSSGSPRIEER